MRRNIILTAVLTVGIAQAPPVALAGDPSPAALPATAVNGSVVLACAPTGTGIRHFGWNADAAA